MDSIFISSQVKVVTLCIYAALAILTAGAYIVSFAIKKECLNFKQRMKTLWVILALFTLAFVSNRAVTYAFLGFISYLALKEYLSIVPTRETDRRVLLWAYLSIPLQFYFLYIGWQIMFYLFVPLYMFILIPIRTVWIGNTQGFIRECGIIHWGLMSTVYCLGYLASYLIVPENVNPAGGLGLLIFIMLFTINNDFMQAICGKTIGGMKIMPKVSPNKTVSGFVGGVILSMCFSALLAPILTPMNTKQALFVGFVLAVAGFMGDVTISALKRDIGVKDSGTMLPGHGGILDRLDSLIFTAPLFFHYIAYTFKPGL